MNPKYEKFTGFSKETFDFLRNLKINNNKNWFEVNKKIYEDYLVNPFKALSAEMAENMFLIDEYLELNPNRTLSRIYRDARFSKGKSPYKTHLCLKFKRTIEGWKDSPSYFFEIDDGGYCFGMGFYCAEKETMDKIRKFIDEKPKEFEKAVEFLNKQKTFELGGEKYKKILDKNKSEKIQNWYQRKNLYLICRRKIDKKLISADIAKELIKEFKNLGEFYKFLWKVKNS